MDNVKDCMESGAWLGRQQAFAVIASKCSAAQAAALKEMKDSRAYDRLGLTWEEFCPRYVGVSRERADAIIRQYGEFGDAYFRLSQLARISPETYRELAPAIEHDTVEIDGQKIDLTLSNAVRIRAALKKMRDQLHEARRAADLCRTLGIGEIRSRQDALVEEARRLTHYLPHNASRNEIAGLAAYAINRWKEVSRELEKS